VVVNHHEPMSLPHKVESGYDIIVGPSKEINIGVGRLIEQKATTQVQESVKLPQCYTVTDT